MITDNHYIAYRNVVSKYYQFQPHEIESAFNDFIGILEEKDFHPTGTMFFTILGDPTEEVLTVEIFLPIEETKFDIQTEEHLYFRSFFSIRPMLMTRILDNFEEASQIKYWELIQYIDQNGLNQRTPIFVEYKKSHAGKAYIEMSVGV